LSNGIGFEDWGWNKAVIAAGALHKVVRGTGHAIRAKRQSLVRMTAAAEAIPAPSGLFRKDLARRTKLDNWNVRSGAK
jgi:hypothetical protein